MIIKVFALGRPGSGKSVAAHRLAEAEWNRGYPAVRLGDYAILHQEAQQEDDLYKRGLYDHTRPRQFYLTDHNGFGVYDFAVLDDALRKLMRQIHDREQRAWNDRQLVVLEFARNNYQHAFEILGQSVLQDAYFLYVNAHVEECIERIKQRISYPTSADDHYVPEAILRTYYNEDDSSTLTSHLATYGVPNKHVIVVENHGAPHEFATHINQISERIQQAIFIPAAA